MSLIILDVYIWFLTNKEYIEYWIAWLYEWLHVYIKWIVLMF